MTSKRQDLNHRLRRDPSTLSRSSGRARRGGNEPQGRRWWVWTVVFITVFALALGGVATGVVCFASDGYTACPTCHRDKKG